jgi:hypothetical protein
MSVGATVILHEEGPHGGGMARGLAGRAGGFCRFAGGRRGHAARAAHAARVRPGGPVGVPAGAPGQGGGAQDPHACFTGVHLLRAGPAPGGHGPGRPEPRAARAHRGHRIPPRRDDPQAARRGAHSRPDHRGRALADGRRRRRRGPRPGGLGRSGNGPGPHHPRAPAAGRVGCRSGGDATARRRRAPAASGAGSRPPGGSTATGGWHRWRRG